ncbi:uncharacterized protein LOC143654272 [Tamandua tetradactyla]|uniref:uncharacterized protein LOC143654272 n=1 Tax=Tamandua tetradactyla TaxID=48850 RepID=UPI0040547D56
MVVVAELSPSAGSVADGGRSGQPLRSSSRKAGEVPRRPPSHSPATRPAGAASVLSGPCRQAAASPRRPAQENAGAGASPTSLRGAESYCPAVPPARLWGLAGAIL